MDTVVVDVMGVSVANRYSRLPRVVQLVIEWECK